MDDNLADLCATLSLTEEEQQPFDTDDLIFDELDLSTALIGKIMVHRTVSYSHIVSVFRQLWKPKSGLVCKSMGDNIVLFMFKSAAEKRRVFADSPWHFDKHLMVLSDCSPDLQISDIPFDRCQFWVQVHHLPLSLMTETFAKRTGNSLGVFKGVQRDNDGSLLGKFLRIRVEIDLSKSLHRFVRVIQKGSEKRFPLRFERLPDFCSYCGRLTHSSKFCDLKTDLLAAAPPKFGPWLRATNFSGPFNPRVPPSTSTEDPFPASPMEDVSMPPFPSLQPIPAAMAVQYSNPYSAEENELLEISAADLEHHTTDNPPIFSSSSLPITEALFSAICPSFLHLPSPTTTAIIPPPLPHGPSPTPTAIIPQPLPHDPSPPSSQALPPTTNIFIVTTPNKNHPTETHISLPTSPFMVQVPIQVDSQARRSFRRTAKGKEKIPMSKNPQPPPPQPSTKRKLVIESLDDQSISSLSTSTNPPSQFPNKKLCIPPPTTSSTLVSLPSSQPTHLDIPSHLDELMAEPGMEFQARQEP